jgi:hypothetical protein
MWILPEILKKPAESSDRIAISGQKPNRIPPRSNTLINSEYIAVIQNSFVAQTTFTDISSLFALTQGFPLCN